MPRRVSWVPVFPGARFPVVAILVWRGFPPAAPSSAKPEACECGIKAWHQGGFGFARSAHTTGGLYDRHVVCDLRCGNPPPICLGRVVPPRRLVQVAEVEVFVAIPIVGYIRVYAGVGLKHVP